MNIIANEYIMSRYELEYKITVTVRDVVCDIQLVFNRLSLISGYTVYNYISTVVDA